MYRSEDLPEVLRSLGEGPVIYGKQGVRGARELGRKHLILGSWGAVSK